MSAFAWFIALIIAVIVLQIVLRLAIPKAPKEKVFHCQRCGAHTAHDDRTIFAWRHGERDFYCEPCNTAWLATCTPQQRRKYERHMARMTRSRRR